MVDFCATVDMYCQVATANGSSLWVATASSSTKKWSIPGKVSIESSLWSSMDGARAVPG